MHLVGTMAMQTVRTRKRRLVDTIVMYLVGKIAMYLVGMIAVYLVGRMVTNLAGKMAMLLVDMVVSALWTVTWWRPILILSEDRADYVLQMIRWGESFPIQTP